MASENAQILPSNAPIGKHPAHQKETGRGSAGPAKREVHGRLRKDYVVVVPLVAQAESYDPEPATCGSFSMRT